MAAILSRFAERSSGAKTRETVSTERIWKNGFFMARVMRDASIWAGQQLATRKAVLHTSIIGQHPWVSTALMAWR
jgi:hypothetical protein